MIDQTQRLDFYDFFNRPEQVVTSLYTDHLGSAIGGSEAARKYQMLFSDTFGHHIGMFLDSDPSLQVLRDDFRRFISSDSLTSYFLDKLYKVPQIYASENSAVTENDLISYPDFLRSVTDTPVTKRGNKGDAIGSNRLSFLVGEIGTGKTLLLSKMIRDILRREAREFPKELLLPVYFDFEIEMKGPNGEMLDVEANFFPKLCNSFLTAMSHFRAFQEPRAAIIAASKLSYQSAEARFISLAKTAHEFGIRILLFLDNVDGYHYYYSKYTFFPKYREQQVTSTQKNIGFLSSVLTSGQRLGMLGMSILIAARLYVYKECIHTIYPETSMEYTGVVYQLQGTNEVDVIASRMALFDKAVETIEKIPDFRAIGEDYKQALRRIGMLLGLREASVALGAGDHEARKVITAIRELSHHGNRGLVSFFSNLRLDYREQSNLIERFLWDKPHTLMLLYIADIRKRYSQARGHFPNLFLVDSIVQKDSDFLDAHQPHVHTYWLKYLMLAYINSQTEGIATERELRRLFVTAGDFDESLFRLALGSLATSREFGCIEPVPDESGNPRRVRIMDRGRVLVSQWRGSKNMFCFSFSYLELMVDDYLMSYPIAVLDDIYISRIDLGYLFEDERTYSVQNRDYLNIKMKCVLSFLKVLKESYLQEVELRKPLFTQLRDKAPAVLLDFERIRQSLFEQFKRITTSFGYTEERMNELEAYWRKVDGATLGREQIKGYFLSKAAIEE